MLAHPLGCNPFLSTPVLLAVHSSALSLACCLSFRPCFTTACNTDRDVRELLRGWGPEGSTSEMQV